MKQNLIYDKSFEFSLSIIELYKILLENKEYIISKQLLRSATSIGANVTEATAAQSKKDFISKLAISSKEARETKYWLLLLKKSRLVEGIDYSSYINDIDEIIKILTSIIKTSQRKN
jgi:four helix bundle protein